MSKKSEIRGPSYLRIFADSARSRAIDALGGVPRSLHTSEMARVEKRVEERSSEAYQDGYRDARNDEPASGDLRSYGYRSASYGPREFAVDPAMAMARAWQLWQENPVADRALEIKRDYVIDRSVDPQAKSPQLQVILKKFWDENRMRRHSSEFALQLFLFGAQCLPVYVRRSDGRVRIGYFDPEQIQQVIFHPENALDIWAVVIRAQVKINAWEADHRTRVYRVIRKDDDVVVPARDAFPADVKTTKLRGLWVTADQANLEPWEEIMLRSFGLDAYSGTCLYERVNAVSNQGFGSSDLLQEADWLDSQDETLFSLADREQRAGYFSWDVTLKGQQQDITKRSAEIRKNPPKNGAINVHNEEEIWEIKTPDLKQVPSIETSKALLDFILGGLGLPSHWYGSGDETNRATAQAQGDPTWKSLSHDQGIIGDMLTTLCEFVRDQAEIAGRWRPETPEDREISVPMPSMTTKDITAVTAAMSNLALSLQTALEMQWITQETAAQTWALMMQELGVDYDVARELKAAEENNPTPPAAGSWFGMNPPVEPGDETPQGATPIPEAWNANR